MPHLPRLQALILADHVYVDAQTGKRVIAGTFNRIWTPSFPTLFTRPTYAYVSLTDIRGKFTFLLRYVDNNSLAVLMESGRVEIEGSDPLATLELGMPVPPFPMPHPGTYSFELHANDTLIGSVRVTASQRQQEQPE